MKLPDFSRMVRALDDDINDERELLLLFGDPVVEDYLHLRLCCF